MANMQAIAGGLLSGIGEGLVGRAEAKREEALEKARAQREERMLRMQQKYQTKRDEAQFDHQLTRDEAQFERQSSRDEADRQHRRGLLSTTAKDESGKLYGITSGGETIDLGITQVKDKAKGSGSSGSSGEAIDGIELSAGEKRTYDEIKARYTDPNLNTVDWDAMVKHLREMPKERGSGRWNQIADFLVGSIGTNMSREEAREKAMAEAEQRKGMFSSRGSEFPETGGDEQAWITMRAQELMGGGQEIQQAQGQNKDQDQKQPEQAAAGAPPGSGTRDDPYKAATQAQIDWFLENAPEGAVIEANGQLYTK